MRVKTWEARDIQLEVRVGAKRECLSKLVARLKHDRIDDDADDERNEEGLRDCFFPQYYANPGESLLRRWTERGVRRDSCAIVSCKTAPRLVVQTSSRILCDSCERSVSAVQGWLFSDSGQSQLKKEQLICTGCLMMASIERWESHECNNPVQLRTDCSVYKKRIAEIGKKPKSEIERVETTAVVQRAMVKTSEYDDGMLIGSRFGFVSELTTRGTTPPLSPISGSSIEQRGYKKVHWTESGFNTLIESSRLFLVMSVFGFGTKWDIGCVHQFG